MPAIGFDDTDVSEILEAEDKSKTPWLRETINALLDETHRTRELNARILDQLISSHVTNEAILDELRAARVDRKEMNQLIKAAGERIR